ncbi:MAG: VOC family protein [Chloroflexi bacterium]|nr:VOC family protein [Chloroflexota bacterium]
MSDWPRPVVIFQIQAKDLEKQKSFYSKMFDWDIEQPEGSPFHLIPAGKGPPENGISGILSPAEASATVIYIQVANLGESLTKAEQLGGKAILQPVDIPNGPTIAQIEDPEGNLVGLIQM